MSSSTQPQAALLSYTALKKVHSQLCTPLHLPGQQLGGSGLIVELSSTARWEQLLGLERPKGMPRR